MQLMVAVFDFPDEAGAEDNVIPEFHVDYIRGYAKQPQ
jgi:hypothetical protein